MVWKKISQPVSDRGAKNPMVRKIAIQGNFVTHAETKPQIFRGKIVSHTNYEPSTPEAYPISGRRDFRKVVPAVGRYEYLAWEMAEGPID